MRIATITNFAYVATVVLTLTSGVALFLASSAEREERAAVAQNRVFDSLTDDLERSVRPHRLARCGDKKQPETIQSWKTREEQDVELENHLIALHDNGASDAEILILRDGISTLDQLEDEQRIAIANMEAGKVSEAMDLLFSANYEERLSETEYRFAHFRSLADQRTQTAINEATGAIVTFAYTVGNHGRSDGGPVSLCPRFYYQTSHSAPGGHAERCG